MECEAHLIWRAATIANSFPVSYSLASLTHSVDLRHSNNAKNNNNKKNISLENSEEVHRKIFSAMYLTLLSLAVSLFPRSSCFANEFAISLIFGRWAFILLLCSFSFLCFSHRLPLNLMNAPRGKYKKSNVFILILSDINFIHRRDMLSLGYTHSFCPPAIGGKCSKF